MHTACQVCPHPVQPGSLGHRIEDVLPRVQRGPGILKYELHVTAVLPERSAGVPQCGALVPDLAAGRLHQANQGAGQRGFAAARLADQRNDLPSSDRQVHVIDRAGGATTAPGRKYHAKAARLQHRAIR